MTTKFDGDRMQWVCTSGFITVRGPSRSGCEQRVREIEERYRQVQDEKK